MKVQTASLKGEVITDFAEARNKELQTAKAEWVFFVDLDEKVTPALTREIANLKPGQCAAFFVKRRNYFLGSDVGEDKIIRLVKKGSGNWQRRVHETFCPRGDVVVGVLKNPLIHYTATNLRDYLVKINSFSSLHALANREEGKKATLFKIIFYPKAKFILTFVKSRHFVFSLMQALHSFLAWSKLYFSQF